MSLLVPILSDSFSSLSVFYVSSFFVVHLWSLFLCIYCQVLSPFSVFILLPSSYSLFVLRSSSLLLPHPLSVLLAVFSVYLRLLALPVKSSPLPCPGRVGSRCSRQIAPYRSQQSAFDLWRECRTRLAPSLGDIDVGTDLSKSCRPGVLISYEIIS